MSSSPEYLDVFGRHWTVSIVELEPVAFSSPERRWYKIHGEEKKQELRFVAGFVDAIAALNYFTLAADNLPL